MYLLRHIVNLSSVALLQYLANALTVLENTRELTHCYNFRANKQTRQDKFGKKNQKPQGAFNKPKGKFSNKSNFKKK